MENLVVHNNATTPKKMPTSPEQFFIPSYHYKLLFCYDQEPLNFRLYSDNIDSRKKIFHEFSENENIYNILKNEHGRDFVLKQNIAGHAKVYPSIYDKKILLHSEKNSKDLVEYEKNNFIGSYYWSHAFIALDWYRFANYDKNLNYFLATHYEKDFNIYCRAWSGTREYRLHFLSKLIKNNIVKNANIFFNEFDNQLHYYDYQPGDTKWHFDKLSLKEQQSNLKLNNNSSELSATYNAKDYKTAAIDVVLETVFDQNKIQLTEKILRPIACGKPFIIVSEKESLEYLKSYGFKTFDSLIDESYDKISDPVKRLEKIVNTLTKITNMQKSKKQEFFSKMHEIAYYNKKHFFSEKFFKKINSELKENLCCALGILDDKRYQTGKNILEMYNILESNKNNLTEFDYYCLNNYDNIISKTKKNIGIS